ncbi:MAG: hypothetical protein GYA24_02815 [Candidatus Lokiarchaeota archaeon]|nr:hypothetical protein [Candidatus Lokiarchaeota archaeon]
MTKKYIKNKQQAGEIAAERVDILMAAAAREVASPGEGQALARRHVHVARKIAMRVRTPLDTGATRRICKKCDSYMLDGTTARVRLQGKGKNAHVLVTCLKCGNQKRYHYRRPRPGTPEGTRP